MNRGIFFLNSHIRRKKIKEVLENKCFNLNKIFYYKNIYFICNKYISTILNDTNVSIYN